jgi:solute:Na+ symporter, SSS family
MTTIDWIIFIGTLLGIVVYGLYKSKTSKNLEGYFLSNRSMPWYLVLLGIMGTQASAITFLSAPGQSFTDGMRFVQYYFGLPLAMIAIVYTFMPLFVGKKLFTPYSWLQERFNVKTRKLASILFLLQRGLSTGISIYAPALIVAIVFNWNIYLTTVIMGGVLIVYTVYGGAKSVAYTQQLQLIIILVSMGIAGYMAVRLLPNGVGFSKAIAIASSAGKMNTITTGFEKGYFDFQDKYNIISGIIGGFFLAFSYFGTDHSQVGRFLTSKSVAESRKGLLMNGLIKIPMQYFILLVGILVFAFYQYKPHDISFNNAAMQYTQSSGDDTLKQMAAKYSTLFKNNDTAFIQERADLRKAFSKRLALLDQKDLAEDTNHVFLSFVFNYLPVGLVGLLLAVIFLAAWGSISAALNSLAACTVIDLLNIQNTNNATEKEEATAFKKSKLITLLWGLFCILVALFAGQMGSLIEAVNVLGSWFYGTVLGIFCTGLWLKQIKGNAVFAAALIVQVLIITISTTKIIPIGFLWYNVIGCLGVVLLAIIFHKLPLSWFKK